MNPDLNRIRLVTAHYGALRAGVTRAAIAPVLIGTGFAGRMSLPVAAAVGTSIVIFSALLDMWMNARFGRVISASARQRWVALVFVLTVFLATRMDRHVIGVGNPSILFLAAAAFALWLAVRLWPLGSHNLLPAVVAIVAAMQFGGVNSAEAFLVWERNAYGSMLLAWTIAGLIDCALLFRALPRNPRAEQASVEER